MFIFCGEHALFCMSPVHLGTKIIFLFFTDLIRAVVNTDDFSPGILLAKHCQGLEKVFNLSKVRIHYYDYDFIIVTIINIMSEL